MDKLYITLENDRTTVSAILIKNGYAVRSGNERRAGTKSYDYFLEFGSKPNDTVGSGGKLRITGEQDQLEVGAILVKNKYTVWNYTQVRDGEKKYYHLCYEPNPDAPFLPKKEAKSDDS